MLLDHLKTWIPRYTDNRIHGAMAWLSAEVGAEAMVETRGLFSIRATGDSASIPISQAARARPPVTKTPDPKRPFIPAHGEALTCPSPKKIFSR